NVVAGSSDFAHFKTGANTYTVTFTNSPSTQGFYVHSDNVTFNLNGNTYTQLGSPSFDPVLVGQTPGENGTLSLSNGSLLTSATNGFNVQIGKAAGALGTVNVQAGATWQMSIGTGALNIGGAGNGTLNLSGVLYLLSSASSFAIGSTGNGTLN